MLITTFVLFFIVSHCHFFARSLSLFLSSSSLSTLDIVIIIVSTVLQPCSFEAHKTVYCSYRVNCRLFYVIFYALMMTLEMDFVQPTHVAVKELYLHIKMHCAAGCMKKQKSEQEEKRSESEN